MCLTLVRGTKKIKISAINSIMTITLTIIIVIIIIIIIIITMVITRVRSTVSVIKPKFSAQSLILGFLKQFQVRGSAKQTPKKNKITHGTKTNCVHPSVKVLDSKHETGPFCSLALS